MMAPSPGPLSMIDAQIGGGLVERPGTRACLSRAREAPGGVVADCFALIEGNAYLRDDILAFSPIGESLFLVAR